MKDSIVINMDYAGYDIIDGTPNVQRHHIFGGTANRRLSDEDGLWVPLSDEHHQGSLYYLTRKWCGRIWTEKRAAPEEL